MGATIVPDARALFAGSDMIVKVKEPQPSEIAMLEARHLLFTYLHLAADKPQAEGLMRSGATCIAYETVTSRSGALPLLKPMSEVAGRMSSACATSRRNRGLGVSSVRPVRAASRDPRCGVSASTRRDGVACVPTSDLRHLEHASPSSTCFLPVRPPLPQAAIAAA